MLDVQRERNWVGGFETPLTGTAVSGTSTLCPRRTVDGTGPSGASGQPENKVHRLSYMFRELWPELLIGPHLLLFPRPDGAAVRFLQYPESHGLTGPFEDGPIIDQDGEKRV